jgi:hypothetical protein
LRCKSWIESINSGEFVIELPGTNYLLIISLTNNYDLGQAASIAFVTSAIDLPSPNHAVNSFHSAPAPTAAGIKSDASKPNVDLGFER